MIVPMQKITLLMLDSEHEKALQILRDLAVLHLEEREVAESAGTAEAGAAAARLERIVSLLSSLQDRTVRKVGCRFSAEQVMEKVERLLREKERCARTAEECARHIEELEPWGEFDPAALRRLKDNGVYVACCTLQKGAFRTFTVEDGAVTPISRRGDRVFFTVTSRQPIADLPLAPLPAADGSLSQMRTRKKDASARLLEIEEELKVIAANDLELLQIRRQETADELDFRRAGDAMQQYGRLFSVSGFIPADQLPVIRNAAVQQGWALLSRNADPEKEAVPTLVRMPKWVRIVTPLFDFLGISPGYTEPDAAPVILLFFTVFFGILVGDAVYGTVFLLLGLSVFFRSSGKAKQAGGFIALLSCSAIVWGMLTNNYCGFRVDALSFLECPALASAADKDANVQYLCFILGVLHLATGHLTQMLRDGRWRNVASQCGWLLLMAANFLLIRTMIVYPGTTQYPACLPYCYGTAVAVLAVCSVDWHDPGSIMGFPSNLINSFVDLLSYIRLFAVGMAGYYLAFSFNGIAGMLMDSPAGVIAGCAVIFIGHLLNIGLAVLSVLVHGVRLNTLEFSSHTGLQWGGFAYQPFAKHKND